MLNIILTCDNVKHECLWLTQNKIALPSRTSGCEQGNGRWPMEQRFVVLAEGAKPKICRPPVNQTAHLINEIPGRKVVVFETLNDAREAALALRSLVSTFSHRFRTPLTLYG